MTAIMFHTLTFLSLCVLSTRAMTIDANVFQNTSSTNKKQSINTAKEINTTNATNQLVTNKPNDANQQPTTNQSDPTPTINRPKQIRIAWLAPSNMSGDYSAETSVNALKFGISVAKQLLLNDIDIKVKWFNSNCSVVGARSALLTARHYFDPDLILGPPCSAGMKEVAALASVWNIPVFSWGSNDPSLDDRSRYTTLVRVYPPLNTFSPVVFFLNAVFNWTRYSVISDTRENYQTVSKAVGRFITESKFTQASTHQVSPNMSDADIQNVFLEIQKNARIVLLSVPWMSMRRYMLIAQELNMTFGDYAFVCINNDVHSDEDLNHGVISDSVWRRNDGFDALAKAAFESVIHIITDISNMNFSFNRLKQYLNQTGEIGLASTHFDLPAGTPDVGVTAPYLYDALMLWAHFANVIISEGGDIRNGSRMFELVRYADVIGLTGAVSMNRHADRMANVWMLDMDLSGMFNDFFHIQNKADGGAILTRPYFECPTEPGVYDNTCSYDITWPNGLTGIENAPFDTPMCGFQGELCKP